MILTIDIGNTNVHSGIFKGKSLERSFNMPTYSDDIKRRYKAHSGKIDKVIIVSVVPKRLRVFEAAIRDIIGERLFVVGRDVDSGIKNRYRIPGQVGQDRLVNARAAFEFFRESIIVDFGTAITIDVVSKNREYLGGVIVPGVELSFACLSKHAALLPEVKLRKPRSILGRDTCESMCSGAVYGFSSLCDGIVQRIKKRYCKAATVIATGGMSSLIGPYCKTVEKIVPNLTLKGLRIIGESIDV